MAAFSITEVGNALRRRWRLLAALGSVFTSYTLAGFFLVPWLAKSYIESYVREDLGRQVTIGELTFNPFTFAADVPASRSTKRTAARSRASTSCGSTSL